nr:reverse transcriptase [Tanacetum cinerariifolium]
MSPVIYTRPTKPYSCKHFRNNRKVIEELTNELRLVQSATPTAANNARQRLLRKKLEETWRKEEMFWHQRSRVNWIKFGDQNTRFFHLSTIHRSQRNAITMLKNGEGQWVDDPVALNTLIRNHFTSIYTSVGVREFGDVLDVIEPVVTEHMNASLEDIVAVYEIVRAVKQLGAYKSPGKDGFPAPVQVGHFRPISLCNFVYRIISKIMANRLKPFIHCLISPQQSTFIPGRLIQDSMVITNEAFHYIRHKNKGNQRLMALKLDFNKAFDRVEWDFLAATLKKMGFVDRWCQWILACLTSYELEFLINGESISNIQPTRGIRQGDPLSPYLFIIIADVLSRMVSKAVDNSLVSGIKMARTCPIISHKFFADDSLFFLKANRAECQNLVNILARYCSASGQNINFAKSSAFFSPNCPADLEQQLCDLLNVQRMDPKARYLGLPSLVWDLTLLGCGKVSSTVEMFSFKVSDGREADFVSQIPISNTGAQDKLVWHYDAKGNYYVRSGYRQALLLKEKETIHASSSSNPTGIGSMYRSIMEAQWILLTSSIVKLNCDAFFKNPNAALVIVARNSEGSLLACFSKKWRCDYALAAELQAI